MEKDIIKDIITDIGTSTKDKGKFIKLSSGKYEPVEISNINFHEITELNVTNKIAFVDGGNAEILKAANFSLQLIRVYYTIYQNNKRISNKRFEFYLLVKSFSNDDKISYKTKTFGDKIIEGFDFDSFDKTITQGNNRADVSFVGNVIRRFSELIIAKELVKDLDKDDIIVLDGSLEAKYTHETKILNELSFMLNEKNIILCGFSKSCELLTDKGSSIIAALGDIQPKYEWYYYPAAKLLDDKYQIFFTKLNKNSDYIFRIDTYGKSVDDVFSLLKQNSKDPVFLGYPYGLIEADKFARISNKELDVLKTRFMAIAGKNWNSIHVFLKTKDSHAILDSIS